MKNASPGRIVFASSCIILLLLLILELLGFLLPALSFPAYQYIIIPIIVVVAVFLLFYYTVEKFIYRKIKLVYKNIHGLKSTKGIAVGSIPWSMAE